MPDVIAPGTHALESGARRAGGPLARRHGRAVLIINRCDRVAVFVVPVAAKIAKLAAFEPMRRCAAKAVRALLEYETQDRQEARRDGKEGVSAWRSRWWAYTTRKKKNTQTRTDRRS